MSDRSRAACRMAAACVAHRSGLSFVGQSQRPASLSLTISSVVPSSESTVNCGSISWIASSEAWVRTEISGASVWVSTILLRILAYMLSVRAGTGGSGSVAGEAHPVSSVSARTQSGARPGADRRTRGGKAIMPERCGPGTDRTSPIADGGSEICPGRRDALAARPAARRTARRPSGAALLPPRALADIFRGGLAAVDDLQHQAAGQGVGLGRASPGRGRSRVKARRVSCPTRQ